MAYSKKSINHHKNSSNLHNIRTYCANHWEWWVVDGWLHLRIDIVIGWLPSLENILQKNWSTESNIRQMEVENYDKAKLG
jgi:hypothetical protein